MDSSLVCKSNIVQNPQHSGSKSFTKDIQLKPSLFSQIVDKLKSFVFGKKACNENCDFNNDCQREYFDGKATLVPLIGDKNNCKITHNDERVFELNFTEDIEKPEFIDKIVLYTIANPSFVVGNEYTFGLKIMQIDSKTEEVELSTLPQEAKIIRWSYWGGYVDGDGIWNNSTMKTKLYPEMLTSPKHTLLIKYQNRVFKKVVYCNFSER